MQTYRSLHQPSVLLLLILWPTAAIPPAYFAPFTYPSKEQFFKEFFRQGATAPIRWQVPPVTVEGESELPNWKDISAEKKNSNVPLSRSKQLVIKRQRRNHIHRRCLFSFCCERVKSNYFFTACAVFLTVCSVWRLLWLFAHLLFVKFVATAIGSCTADKC